MLLDVGKYYHIFKPLAQMKSAFLFGSQRLAESAEDADLYHEFNTSLKVSGHKAPDLFYSTFNHTNFTLFSLITTTP